jgi:FecR protein
MPRLTIFLPLALATLSAVSMQAQADVAGQTTSLQNTPAPIVRSAPDATEPPPQGQMSPNGVRRGNYLAQLAAGQLLTATNGIANAQPVAGVYMRVAPHSAVREVSTTPQRTEFRVEHGVANISVNHPQDGMLLLVDLPGGQVQMLKNGLYTFNAQTNTVRVLKGEAKAFGSGVAASSKPVKVKEQDAITFPPVGSTEAKLHTYEFAPFQIGHDLIPQPYTMAEMDQGPGYGSGGYGDGYYRSGYGFYGGPYAVDPYYAWGGAWNPFWDGFYGGYPFGLGIGFGYGGYGYGGRFRGGYGGYGGGRIGGGFGGGFHGGGGGHGR